ncbi:MAG: RNA-binding cell elongation regulator Jag/EloR [Thermodesulfobacteriota bacterium]|nr:RNA-binding cell elongation regulator Jag/EloR [Thermodesulfobacteriota bacterium]
MNSIETEGKTIEEAISKACQELKASREDLEIEILANGSSGFLGLVGAKKAQIRATRKTPPAPERKEADFSSPPPSHSPAETAKKTLQDLLHLLGMEAEVELKDEPERILLHIKGDGSGLLIGRKGQTLDALEYLINKIVHKGAEDKKRIVVDTENYRSRREESLANLAHRLADKAKKLGRPVTISPMNAHDRRIIHLTLQDDKTLRTWSTGTGLYRKIIISPEKKTS